MSYPQFDPASQAPQPWQSPAPVQGRSPARWLPILGAGLGLLGLIAGVGAWMRPAPSGGAVPVYSDQQVADAKKAVCEAYAKGMRSIRIVAKRQPANDADRLGVAVNSRVGLVAVSTYFNDKLEANLGAPSEIREQLAKLAHQYQEVALAQLADGTPSDYKSNLEAIDATVAELDKLCQ